MTKDDAEKIVMMMEAAYPNYHPNKRYTVNAWGVLLKDYDYDVVEMALKSYIMSENKGFAPSIGQIVDIIHRIQRPDRLNCAQAWALVSKAMKNSIYHSVEEFEKLPKTVQNAVGSPGELRSWATSENFNENVTRSTFYRIYNQELEKEIQSEKSTNEFRNAIESKNSKSERMLIDSENEKSYQAVRNNTINEIDLDAVNSVPMPERYREEFCK